MPHSTSILAYNDCKTAMDRALTVEKGIRLTFTTRALATRFISRCSAFRHLDRKENMKIHTEPGHSLHGRSVYDALSITQQDNVVKVVSNSLTDAIIEDIE